MSSVAWGNSCPSSFPTSYVYFTWSQYNFAPILITQRFAWCTSVVFINGWETSKTKVWLSEQDTLLNAPYTLYIFFETIQLYVHTVTQVQCSLLTFECGIGVTSFAQLKLVGARYHCLRLESPRLGWRQNSCNSSTNPLSRKWLPYWLSIDR